MVPFSLERAARIAAKTAPAGGEEKTRPQTAAVKRPCPTKPTQNVRFHCEQSTVFLLFKIIYFYRQHTVRALRRLQQ
jgi:hypothetical protein